MAANTKKKITELLLKTPGACFLCLQNDQKDEGGHVEDLNGRITELTTICRYLNINQSSLLANSLKSDEEGTVSEDLEQNVCTFSVNLCPKCLELTEKLNKMIVQLEQAKLSVNFHLSSFHKVLEGSRMDDNLEGTNLQERMKTNSGNSVDAKLVQLLREQVQHKSSKILKKGEEAMPPVILSKCQVPPSPPKPPGYPPPPFASSANPSISSIIPSTSSATTIKNLLSQLVASNAITSEKCRKSQLYHCPFCNKILGYSKFAPHLSCLHPDKLLSSYFPPPSLAPSEQICRHVLSSQMIAKAVKIPSCSTPTAPPRLGCHLCGKTYCHGDPLKQHFLVTHTDQLIDELNKFVETSNKISSSQLPISELQLIKSLAQTSLIKPSKNDKDASKGHQCPFCQENMIHSKFARHLSTFHPDKLLAPFTPSLDKLRNDSPMHFSQLCRNVLVSQVGLAGECPSSSSTSSASSKLGCHLCARRYSDRRDLMHHLLVKHTDNLSEQLINMQSMKTGQDKMKKRRKMVNEKVKPLKAYHRTEMEGELKDKLGEKRTDNRLYWGGDEEGDNMVIEEGDGSEFDVKPVIGEEDMEYLNQLYGYFEEDGGDHEVDDSLMRNLTNEKQIELLDNQSVAEPPIIKMEVD